MSWLTAPLLANTVFDPVLPALQAPGENMPAAPIAILSRCRLLFRLGLATVTLWIGTGAGAEEERADGPRLILIENSPGISQVIDLNMWGMVLGAREVSLPSIGLGEEPFFLAKEGEAPIPRLEGYTNHRGESISDDGWIVGYVSRAETMPRLLAFAWQTGSQRAIPLEPPPHGTGSHAFDISSDGRTVVGYLTAPQRMVPCVWERGPDEAWSCTELSVIHPLNPFLQTSRVVVSGDGTRIVACLTVKIIPDPFPQYISHVFEWLREEDGSWARRKRLEDAARLGDVNNHGLLVGSYKVDGHRRAFVSQRQNDRQALELLPGDISSEALDVNDQGIVVGCSDDPHGPQGGPQAFRWEAGTMCAIEFPEQFVFSSATAINARGEIAGYLVPRDDVSKWGRTVSFVLAK
jgi:uncharacterized membrane protein